MKPLNLAISLAALALPLSAADQPKPNTTTTTLSAPAPSQQQDSPLVRAAKATGRLNKKPGFVITNDTLLKTGGHIGVGSAEMQAAPLPKGTVVTTTYRRPVVQGNATDARAKELAKARAAADLEGDTLEPRVEDPAVQEHQMQKMTVHSPTTQPASKPPGE